MPTLNLSVCRFTTLAFGLAGLALAGAAGAHHPMGGGIPSTSLQGLLSGLGHPVIEWEHLLFLLIVGLSAASAPISRGKASSLLIVFAGLSSIGVAWRVVGVAAPLVEASVGLSLLLAALWLWTRFSPGVLLGALCSAFAGFAHGYMYGEAVVGAEATPIRAYLLGLAIVQSLLMMGVFLAVRHLNVVASPKLIIVTRGLAVIAGSVGLWMSWTVGMSN